MKIMTMRKPAFDVSPFITALAINPALADLVQSIVITPNAIHVNPVTGCNAYVRQAVRLALNAFPAFPLPIYGAFDHDNHVFDVYHNPALPDSPSDSGFSPVASAHLLTLPI